MATKKTVDDKKQRAAKLKNYKAGKRNDNMVSAQTLGRSNRTIPKGVDGITGAAITDGSTNRVTAAFFKSQTNAAKKKAEDSKKKKKS